MVVEVPGFSRGLGRADDDVDVEEFLGSHHDNFLTEKHLLVATVVTVIHAVDDGLVLVL